MLGHGHAPGFDVAVIVSLVAGGHQVVQRGQRTDPWDRDHVAAAEPADLSFDPALLMRSFDAGQAEEGLEAVVAAHGDEPFGLDPAAPLHDPHHGRLEVVIADALRHATEMGEGPDMAVEEHLLGLVEIDPVESLPAGREPHHEHPGVDHGAVEKEAHLAEVDLGLVSQVVGLGDADVGQRQRTLSS